VADIDAASGRRLAGALGPRLRFLACNASDEASIAAFCARVLRDGGGRLDCLVNNVGVQCDDGTPAHELPTRVWAKVIAINLTSYFLFARACLPALMETAAKEGGGSAGAAGGGSAGAAGGGGGGSACIINMSSVQGLQSQPGIPAYAASKGGILSLTRQMSMDYASKGVRVVAINPGTIRTPLVENLLCGRHGKEYLPEALRKAGAAYPMGRIGEIEEIAETAVFLAGGGASFITGESVTVDGGIMAMGGWAGTA
jgi:NAD(P)-dependent dehydrogenase (short-subunit alcohol dehydrogenase family)